MTLLEANATKIRSGFLDYRNTPILLTQGAAESSPYARDAALDSFRLRKRGHRLVDRACSEASLTEQQARKLHTALDQMLDSEGAANGMLGEAGQMAGTILSMPAIAGQALESLASAGGKAIATVGGAAEGDDEWEPGNEDGGDPNYALHEPAAEEGEDADGGRKRLHAMLDRMLDSMSEEDEEAEDDGEENEEPKEKARVPRREQVIAADRKVAMDVKRVARSAGFICDSDYIAKYLNPNALCREVGDQLYETVYSRQANDANRGYWSGLYYFLRSEPEGRRIRDCRPATLSMLISKTLAA